MSGSRLVRNSADLRRLVKEGGYTVRIIEGCIDFYEKVTTYAAILFGPAQARWNRGDRWVSADQLGGE